MLVEVPTLPEMAEDKNRRLLRTGERDGVLHRVECCQGEGVLAGREFLNMALATEYGLTGELTLHMLQTMCGVETITRKFGSGLKAVSGEVWNCLGVLQSDGVGWFFVRDWME